MDTNLTIEQIHLALRNSGSRLIGEVSSDPESLFPFWGCITIWLIISIFTLFQYKYLLLVDYQYYTF